MSNKGVWMGAGAYLMWGFFPAYFKALQVVPPLQILFHRVVWSFFFLAVVVVVIKRDWQAFKQAIMNRRVILVYAIAGVLLAINWGTYVWAVNAGFVVETSLGYFINPLVSVALGVIFLGERLRPAQWIPVGLAAAGVLYLTLQVGSLPWIALVLAFSFGLYGLMKKVSPLGSLYGLTIETGVLFLPGLAFLVYAESQGVGAFGHVGWVSTLLLVLVGVVTATPLLMFATAAKSIPLWMVGLLQYIAPTCQFLLGIFAYGEPFTSTQLIGFSIIWAALLLFTTEGFAARRKAAPLSAVSR